MNKKILSLVTTLFLFPNLAFAAVTAVEGDQAKQLYEANKATSVVIAQKDKKFLLRTPGGGEEATKQIKIKAGQQIFITNEEEKYVHNIYDAKDTSWSLKKQAPSDIAAITFSEPGKHNLRCAIHPNMKIKVTVE